MHARHRLVSLSIALFTVLAGPWARAADPWPTKPIRIIVPYTPGGLVDVLARLIGAKISPTLGQPVVVENKPGASTAIGAEFVAKSAPDGHTLLLATTTTLSTNPLMFKRLSYKTSEFTPVALLAMVPFIAVANPGAPFSNVKELMDYAKVNPGKITFSTSGVGTASHLIGELFAAATGTKLTDIPYKGTNPAMMAVLSGEVTMAFDSAGLYTAPVQSGRLKAIAQFGDTRMPAFDKLPTMLENGFKDAVSTAWFGIVAPSGTPKDVVTKLNEAVAKAMRDPEVVPKLYEFNGYIEPHSPEQFRALLQRETLLWSSVLAPLNIRLD